jgi:EmrB/QacA subfamily drug resistance transporter
LNGEYRGMGKDVSTSAANRRWAGNLAAWRARRGPWWAWSTITISSFMMLLDTAIVNVARPAIASGLHISLDQTVWVSTAYLLAFAVPLLLAARLGDRFGARRVLVAGLCLFVGASGWCGLAPGLAALIAARSVQGVGAAAMTPQAMPVLNRIFAPGQRGAPLGLVGTVGGLASTASPLIGGMLVQSVGWRFIFLINVPVGVLAVVLIVLLVPSLAPVHRHRFDIRGVVLSCTGLALVVYGIQDGPRYRWGSIAGPISIPVILAVGAVLLAAFVVSQRHVREPILNLRLFRHRNFSLANVADLSIGFAMPALWIPLLIYLQSVLGLSAFRAGLLATPVSATAAIVAPLAGRLSDRLDGRWVTLVSFVFFGAGMATIALRAGIQTQPATLIPELVGIGVGTGALFAPLTNLAFTDLPDDLTATGSGVFNTTSQIGGILGVAVVGALMATQRHSGDTELARTLADATEHIMLIGIIACLTMKPRTRRDDLPPP